MMIPFELPAELTIYAVASTHQALLVWLKEQAGCASGPLQVSARYVSEIDGAGLQLLVALSKAEAVWELRDASSVFIDACRMMGLSSWLQQFGRFDLDVSKGNL